MENQLHSHANQATDHDESMQMPPAVAPSVSRIAPSVTDEAGGLLIDGVDLQQLRVDPAAASTIAVRPVVTRIPIAKPKRSDFIQVCTTMPDFPYTTMATDAGKDAGFYVVAPPIDQLLQTHVKPYSFHLAINRANQLFVIPVCEALTHGRRHSAHESLLLALEEAKKGWVQVYWDADAGGYLVDQALAALSPPTWPSLTPAEILKLTFGNRIIKSQDHPVVQSLLGMV